MNDPFFWTIFFYMLWFLPVLVAGFAAIFVYCTKKEKFVDATLKLAVQIQAILFLLTFIPTIYSTYIAMKNMQWCPFGGCLAFPIFMVVLEVPIFLATLVFSAIFGAICFWLKRLNTSRSVLATKVGKRKKR